MPFVTKVVRAQLGICATRVANGGQAGFVRITFVTENLLLLPPEKNQELDSVMLVNFSYLKLGLGLCGNPVWRRGDCVQCWYARLPFLPSFITCYNHILPVDIKYSRGRIALCLHCIASWREQSS